MTAANTVKDALLTVREVAAQLHIHPQEVYGLTIPRIKLSTRRLRFRQRDVDAYVSARTAP